MGERLRVGGTLGAPVLGMDNWTVGDVVGSTLGVLSKIGSLHWTVADLVGLDLPQFSPGFSVYRRQLGVGSRGGEGADPTPFPPLLSTPPCLGGM